MDVINLYGSISNYCSKNSKRIFINLKMEECVVIVLMNLEFEIKNKLSFGKQYSN